MVMIKCLDLEKKKEKQKAQGKDINYRSHFVLVIETLSECDHIRIDSHTIKRGETRIEIRLLKCH